MIEQNLTLCIILSILGGVLQVLSVLVLAYPEHIERSNPHYRTPDFVKNMLYLLNILIQVVTVFVNIGATIYGPVAIVYPLFVASQLLFNMIVFGFLGMEEFSKDVQVGTFMVILGSVFLPIVGPTVQQDQDIMVLLASPIAVGWTAILSIGILVTGMICFMKVNKWEVNSTPVYVVLTVARVFSGVLSGSLSKAFAMASGGAFVGMMIGFVLCNVVLMTAVVQQATLTEQKVFVPVSSCMIQVVNAMTGLILWEDWKVVQNWTGYVGVIIQIIVGIYLISSLDFFKVHTGHLSSSVNAEPVFNKCLGERDIEDAIYSVNGMIVRNSLKSSLNQYSVLSDHTIEQIEQPVSATLGGSLLSHCSNVSNERRRESFTIAIENGDQHLQISFPLRDIEMVRQVDEEDQNESKNDDDDNI